MASFNAFWVEKDEQGTRHQVITRELDDLPEGDVLIEVLYSSVNYKDAMSASGVPGVTKQYPHTPGIDAAGIVRASTDPTLSIGSEVLVIGFDLGMNTPGGFRGDCAIVTPWI